MKTSELTCDKNTYLDYDKFPVSKSNRKCLMLTLTMLVNLIIKPHMYSTVTDPDLELMGGGGGCVFCFPCQLFFLL